MRSRITVKRVSGASIYKMLFIGSLCFHIVTTLLTIALVMSGAVEVTESAVTDAVSPLLFLGAYLLVGVLLSPLWVGALWLSIWPGLWFYSLFWPLRLGYVSPEE